MIATQEYVGLQSKVLARVRERGGETHRDIASYLEADYRAVHKALSRLCERGQVMKQGVRYFPIEAPVRDVFDAYVEAAEQLSRLNRPTKIPLWRKWLFGRWLNLPSQAYVMAIFLGYSAGRFH